MEPTINPNIREVIFNTQTNAGAAWRLAAGLFLSAAIHNTPRLEEMQKRGSKWGYHFQEAALKYFDSGKFEKGYENPFQSALTEIDTEYHRMRIVDNLSKALLQELAQNLMHAGLVKREQVASVTEFLYKKARDKKLDVVLDLYPPRLEKLFNKINTITFKSPALKSVYNVPKETYRTELKPVGKQQKAILNAFLEKLKQNPDLNQLQTQLITSQKHLENAHELLAWIMDVITEQDVTSLQGLINASTKKSQTVIALLTELQQKQVFADQNDALKEFFGQWGQLLLDISGCHNRAINLHQDYQKSQQALDKRHGLRSLQLELDQPITIDLCNAFFTIAGRPLVTELPLLPAATQAP